MSLSDQIDHLRNGSISSLELVKRTFDLIEKANDSLNAFCYLRKEEALREASIADKELSNSSSGKLLGVPVAIKDDIDLLGCPTRYGTSCNPPYAKQDCGVVAKLKKEGAIIVGKTQSSELGLWPISGNSSVGYVHNPWKHGLTAGGSSGGSAAALAAGLVSSAIGSDGAGSLRIPAAWCNLVSIKPQRGRVPTFPWPEINNGLHVIGPMARNVRDAAILLDAISGAHNDDIHKASEIDLIKSLDEKPPKLRIGLILDPPFTGYPVSLDPEIKDSITRLASTLESLGHTVHHTKIPHTKLLYLNFLPRSIGATNDWYDLYGDKHNMEARTRHLSVVSRGFRGVPLSIARRAETRLQKMTAKIFDKFDVLLSPVTASLPPKVDAIEGKNLVDSGNISVGHCPYTWTWNVTGWPSVSIPSGFSSSGLPIGAQLMGPSNSEELLVSLASELEPCITSIENRPDPWWIS